MKTFLGKLILQNSPQLPKVDPKMSIPKAAKRMLENSVDMFKLLLNWFQSQTYFKLIKWLKQTFETFSFVFENILMFLNCRCLSRWFSSNWILKYDFPVLSIIFVRSLLSEFAFAISTNNTKMILQFNTYCQVYLLFSPNSFFILRHHVIRYYQYCVYTFCKTFWKLGMFYYSKKFLTHQQTFSNSLSKYFRIF